MVYHSLPHLPLISVHLRNTITSYNSDMIRTISKPALPVIRMSTIFAYIESLEIHSHPIYLNACLIVFIELGGDAKQQTHSTPFDGEDSGLVLMAEQLIEDAESDAVQDEWKLAAKVLNRFFLWLYTLSVVLGVVGIFLQTPGLIVARPTIPNSAL